MTLVWDFDSTLVVDESLVSMLEYALKDDLNANDKIRKIQEITELGNRGFISIHESYKRRLNIAKPTLNSLKNYLMEAKKKDKITPGLRELLKEIRNRFPSIDIQVLSQGPKCVIDEIAQTVDIPPEKCHAVILDVAEGEKNGKYISDEEPMLLLGKSKMIRKLIQEGRMKEPIIMIGDGASDLRTKQDGVSKIAILFGVNVQRSELKSMADYYVTKVEELRDVLFKILEENKI